jgi:CRISPR type IV-associated protein Csf1
VLWASDIALQALRRQPVGEPWAGPNAMTCSHCGKPIQSGEPHVAVRVGELFSDTRDLASDSGIVCGGCAVLRAKKSMNGLSFMVLTPEGLFPIAQSIHKAWLFLTPPEPPFVAVHSSATMQHLVWRTPVTLSKERIYLRRGSDLFTLRPATLRATIELAHSIQQRRLAAGEKNAFSSPFLRLDVSKILHIDHGRLNPKVVTVMTAPERQHFYQFTPGELWALGFLLAKKTPTPTRPEPITLKT